MPRILVMILSFFLSMAFSMNVQAKTSDRTLVIGIAVGATGPGDHAYNDMLIMGGRLAHKKYGVEYHIAVPNAEGKEQALQELVDKGCSIIFAGSVYYRDAVDHLALKFPNVSFILFDCLASRYLKNVSSVTFRSNEVAFLAGFLAARMSQTQTICVIGGQKMAAIGDFTVGFESGASYASKDVRVLVRYLPMFSKTFNPWNSPETAEALTTELVTENRCDVVFGVAGSSNRGIFKVAEKKEVYAIGVDSDQDFLAPGYILASVMKRCDTAIVRLTGIFLDNELENKNYSFGLGEYGVGLSPMTYTLPLIDKDTLITLDRLRFAIAGGKILVPGVSDHCSP